MKKGGAKARSPVRKSTKDKGSDIGSIARISEEDISNVGSLFKSVINLYDNITDEEVRTLNAQFSDHITHVTNNLQRRLEGVTDQYQRCAEFILAKHAFGDICTAEILRFVKRSGNADLAEVLTHTFGLHQQLLRCFPPVVAATVSSHREDVSRLRSQVAASERDTSAALEAAEALDRQKHSATRSLKEQVEQLRRQKEDSKRGRTPSPSKRGGHEQPKNSSKKSDKGRTDADRRRSPGAKKKGGRDGGRSDSQKSRSQSPTRPTSRGGSKKGGRDGGRSGSPKSRGESQSPPRPTSRGGSARGRRGGQDEDDAVLLSAHAASTASFDAAASARPRSAGGRMRGSGLPVTMTESFQRLTQPKKTPAERAAEQKRQEELEERRRREAMPEFQRKLTLNQLKALIEEIYSSKQKYNKICEESQLPYETLEQHVYTFLNQKYGLKKIILGWLKGIKEAVQEYRRTDPDIRCFSRILFNELHEDYLWEYHYNLKRKMNQMLYNVIQIENPKVSEADLAELFQERVNDYLTKEEWIYMVEDIYQHKHDQEILIRRMLDAVALEKEKDAKDDPAAALRPKSIRQQQQEDPEQSENLLQKDFVKIVLNYQLEGHVKFLSRFKILWEAVWTGGEERTRNRRAEAEAKWSEEKKRNPDLAELPPFEPRTPGVIDEEDFMNLIESLDPAHNHKDIIQLLNEVDPFETNKITFSQCVKVLMPLLKELEVRMEHEADDQAEQALKNPEASEY